MYILLSEKKNGYEAGVSEKHHVKQEKEKNFFFV